MNRFLQKLSKDEKGVTFLELVILIVVIGILSYLGMANLSNSNDSIKESSLAKKILADVRYAQEMAMSHGQLVQFIVETGQNRYSLKWADNSYVQTPMAEKDFIVDVDDSYFVGVSISSTGFSSGTLQFDSQGAPLNNGSTLSVETTLLQLNGSATLRVVPGTGRCFIQ